MRTFALLGATCLLCGCSSTTMAEPRLLVSPYLAIQQLRGEVSLQSEPTPGTLQDNGEQTLRTFGQDHYREDIGVRVDFGDGFAGFRVDYLQLAQNTNDSGVLEADWGTLLAGDVVRMDVDMDELRIGYLETLFHGKTTWRDRPLALQFAAGAVVAHRELDLSGETLDRSRQQRVEVEGDVAYAAARLRLGWRDIALDVDYAISPELALGGDFEGTLQDIEVRASYTLPMRDLTFFGGWRYSTLPGEGNTGRLAYDADLVLDGFQLGVVLTF